MANHRFIHRFQWGLFLVVLILFSGCRTAPPPAPEKSAAPAPSSSAAAAESAAEKAFDELAHPNRQPSPSSQPSPQAPPQSAPVPRTTPPPKAAQAPAVKEVGGQRQDWIDGTSTNYPATRYLTGVGSGSDRLEAEDNARAEIAKVISSHVISSTKVQQEYLEVITEGKNRASNRINVQDMVAVSTQKVLSGVRIAEVYRETGGNRTFYALAVLDRRQTTTALKEKLRTFDQEIATLMAQASKEAKDLQKLKIYTAALEKHLLREACEAELRVVDSSGRGMAAPIGFEDIKRPMANILAKDFRIHVAVSGDRAAEVAKALSEGLTREGFVLTGNPGRAKVAVKGKVSIKPLDRPDEKWKYVRWQTSFELVDLSDQTIFGTLSNNGREGHLSLEQAVNRAVMKIQKELLPGVSKDVYQYIFGKSSNL